MNVEGLTLHAFWLSEGEQAAVITRLLAELAPIRATSLKQDRSKILRYGWSYEKPAKLLPQWPSWLEDLRQGLPHVASTSTTAITINEYAPGHCIGPHVDSDLFGEPIQILSLGAPAVMRFMNETKSLPFLELPPGSLLSLSNGARWCWRHAIESVSGLRYSIVFRELLTEPVSMTMTTRS